MLHPLYRPLSLYFSTLLHSRSFTFPSPSGFIKSFAFHLVLWTSRFCTCVSLCTHAFARRKTRRKSVLSFPFPSAFSCFFTISRLEFVRFRPRGDSELLPFAFSLSVIPSSLPPHWIASADETFCLIYILSFADAAWAPHRLFYSYSHSNLAHLWCFSSWLCRFFVTQVQCNSEINACAYLANVWLSFRFSLFTCFAHTRTFFLRPCWGTSQLTITIIYLSSTFIRCSNSYRFLWCSTSPTYRTWHCNCIYYITYISQCIGVSSGSIACLCTT